MMHSPNEKPRKKRLFIGVPLCASIEVLELLEQLRELQEQGIGDLRPVLSENLHLTLEFLGSVPEESLTIVEQALGNALLESSPFELRLRGMAAFRTAIWLGVSESVQLQSLVQKVRANMSAIGFASDGKPFQAHITVARLKPDEMPKLSDLLAKYSAQEWGPMAVKSVQIFESRTLPEGAVYRSIKAISLGIDSTD